MNNLSTLRESIKEQLDDYDNMDFYEVFIKSFRRWSSEKLSEEEKDGPLSYLLLKHGNQFVTDMLGSGHQLTKSFTDANRYTMGTNSVLVGKQLVIKGLQKLPSMRKKELFMDTYGKHLKRFVKSLNIPSWIKIEYEEYVPYDLKIIITYDYDNFLKEDTQSDKINQIKRRIKEFIIDTLGMNIGNPMHGGLRFNTDTRTNVDGWVKKILNGVIKKDIKNIDGADRIVHSIKFESMSNSAELKIVRKSTVSWSAFDPFRGKVRDYLASKGYTKIRVEY